MISHSLTDALNEQLKQELYSSYLYLQMSAYCESQNLPGFAHWMRLQSEEERGHAMKFYDHILDRGGQVVLASLPQPPSDYQGPIAIFELALGHEQEITSLIEQLYRQAEAEQDHSTQVFLQWFISEQVEEEKTASTVLETLRMAGDNKVALLMIDRELGARAAAGA
ncbi:MAG: ferritin [Chloroflexi bacterium]|nr:ferritin [Chloroflexota bacterium]